MRPRIALAAALATACWAPAAAAFDPNDPRPPAPAPFVEAPKPGSFLDLRLAVSYGAGVDSTANHGGGSVRNAAALNFELAYAFGLPSPLLLFGIEAARATTDLLHPSSTLFFLCPYFGIGAAIPITYNVHLEIAPYVEFVADSIDRLFTSSVAWGQGVGGGGRATVAYTFDNGLQLGLTAGYSARYTNLTGDCGTCAAPAHYDDHVTVQMGRAALSIGKRF